MIDTLKFYKLCTLQEVYDWYINYMRAVVPLDTTFGAYVNRIKRLGWRIQ